MSPGLIAISEWRTVRPKRAQPLAEPQFLGACQLGASADPSRSVGRESDRDFGEFAWQFGEMATKGPHECFRVTDSRRLKTPETRRLSRTNRVVVRRGIVLIDRKSALVKPRPSVHHLPIHRALKSARSTFDPRR